MGESEEDKSSVPLILVAILVASIIFVVATLVAPLFPAGSSHPPQVIIWRENPPTIFATDRIHVKYIGGIDDGFVGDFRIVLTDGVGNVAFSRDYPKPQVYYDVAVFDIPPGTLACVNASAIDKATRTYRPIGYNCT